MRPRFFMMILLCFILLFIMGFSAYAGNWAEYNIIITAPENGSSIAEIILEDISGAGFEKAEARLNEDGEWLDISDSLLAGGRAQVELFGSGTVYAAVTDNYGNTHVKSLYVELGEEAANQPLPPPTEKSVTPVDGGATVIENSVKAPGEREFYTIQSEKGNIFFIVIDKEKPDKNVYLLTEVTEDELPGLIKPEITEPDIPDFIPDIIAPEPEPAPETAPKSKTNSASVLLIVFIALVCGGAGYYFKILRPKQNAELYDEDDEGEESEQDEDEEYEFEADLDADVGEDTE